MVNIRVFCAQPVLAGAGNYMVEQYLAERVLYGRAVPGARSGCFVASKWFGSAGAVRAISYGPIGGVQRCVVGTGSRTGVRYLGTRVRWAAGAGGLLFFELFKLNVENGAHCSWRQGWPVGGRLWGLDVGPWGGGVARGRGCFQGILRDFGVSGAPPNVSLGRPGQASAGACGLAWRSCSAAAGTGDRGVSAAPQAPRKICGWAA